MWSAPDQGFWHPCQGAPLVAELELDANTNVEKSDEILSSAGATRFAIPHTACALSKQRVPPGEKGRQHAERGRIHACANAQWRRVAMKRGVQQINLRQNDDQHDHCQGT